MVYGYMRVSTAFEQSKERNQSFDRQLMILKENGVKEENIFQDRISGGVSTKDRPQFDKMLSMLQKGDMIIVTEMSRFSRSLQDLIESVNILTAKKIGITFLKENIVVDDNGLNPMNKFIFQLFGAFAEFEKSLIAERVKFGMQASKLKGTKLGAPTKIKNQEIQDNFVNDYNNGLSIANLMEKYGLSKPSVISMAKRLGCKPRNKRKLDGETNGGKIC